MSKARIGPMVQPVQSVEWDQVDDRLQEQVLAAIRAGDSRQEAELSLEQAHRLMVRRDAYLAGLVRAVQTQAGDNVELYAQVYGSFHGFFGHAVERAEKASAAAACAGPRSEKEVER